MLPCSCELILKATESVQRYRRVCFEFSMQLEITPNQFAACSHNRQLDAGMVKNSVETSKPQEHRWSKSSPLHHMVPHNTAHVNIMPLFKKFS